MAKVKEHAYRLTRNFAIAASAVMLAVGGALAYLDHSATVEQLEDMAERNNATLTQAVANSFWPRFRGFVASAHGPTADDIRADPRTRELHKEVATLVEGTGVLKVKLYDLSGLTAFSTESAQIGKDYSQDEGFLGAARGEIASELEFRETFNAVDGVVTNRWVVSSYVPIRPSSSGGALEGVAEIYSDVTALHAEVQRVASMIDALIAAAFVLIFAILLVIVMYAERRVRRQHQHSLALEADARARAEAANRAKSDFLANMSHELRTPLNAIIGFSELIKEAMMGPVGSPKYKEYAGDIHSAGGHLLTVINDILDVAKIEAGKMKTAINVFDLSKLTGKVIELLEQQSKQAQVAVRLESEAPLMVESDETKVRQILLNLLSNAFKFTPPGGVVTVSLSRDAERKLARIIVADTGIGMREEDITTALTPFGQVDSSLARRHEGTGLGLPLSRQFARLLGGDLELRSAPGVGTEVSVTISFGNPPEVSRRIAAAA